MVTVKVVWQDTGKPAKAQRVSIGFDGWTRGITGDEYTDSNGEAHFDVDPGSDKIYVSGSRVERVITAVSPIARTAT